MKSLAERNGKFWDTAKERLKTYEDQWYSDVVFKEEKVKLNTKT